MSLLKVDIYSFGVNVACGGFLKSQKARLLTARQIFLLFVLLVSHTVASSSLINLFAPSTLLSRSVSHEGSRPNSSVFSLQILIQWLLSCLALLLTVKAAGVYCGDNKVQPRAFELCTNLGSV